MFIAKRRMKKGSVLLLVSMLIILIAIVSFSIITSPHIADMPDSAHAIQIVEVVTNNKSLLVNSDGVIADYILIRNTGNEDINLNGWGVSDSPYKIRYDFSDCILPSGEDLCLFCPGKETAYPNANERYTHFGLSSSGETIVLTQPNGDICQTITVPPLKKNEIYRMHDGIWSVSDDSYLRKEIQYAGSNLADIHISEVLTSNLSYTVGGAYKTSDIIEIFNGSKAPIDLSDYALSDNLDQLESFSFEKNSILAPGDYAIILCTTDTISAPNVYCNAEFSLDSSGESLFLYSKTNRQIKDSVQIPELEPDCSYARNGNQWSVQHSPTPGFPNNAQGIAALDEALRIKNSTGIFISEICASNLSVDLPYVEGHYDYIELYNAGDQIADLTGYMLSNDPKKPRKWELTGLILPPGESLLIYCEPENQGMDTENVIYSNFHLSASGCGVYLYQPDGTLIDRIRVPASYSDTSYGRTLGQSGLYVYHSPTPSTPNGTGYVGYSEAPTVSIKGGMYDRPMTLSLTAKEGAKIYYTLDGSLPTSSSTAYAEPILIEKTTVLRACTLEEGLAESPALTQTYFISTYHTLPVISLTTDPDHLWNEETGMLADGPLLDRETQSRPWLQATYSKKSKYTGYFEYYDEQGIQQLSQGILFRCMGQFSLDMPQKSFSIEANGQFGASAFNYTAFEDRPYTRYSAFALRNGGQDGLYTRVLDGLQARLIDQADSSVITQASKPVIVYLNGQYWGHYNLRERVGIDMIAQHEGWANPDNIDLLEGNGTGRGNVNHGSNADYRKLIEYIKSHSLADDSAALSHVLSQVDVDNMIDYFFFEMFFGNEDSGNIRFYRNAIEGDGKWRYVFYDLDWGLFHSEYGGPEHVLDPKGMGSHRITSNAILIALLEVPEIKERFLLRGGELFQSVLTTDNMIALLERMIQEIRPEMQMHFGRWAAEMYPQISADQPKNPEGAYFYWQQRVERAKNVMKKRPYHFWNMIKDYFELGHEDMLLYFGECPALPDDVK